MKNIKLVFSLLLILLLPQIIMAQPTANISELTQKADNGDKQAQEDLGRIYLMGTGVPVDYALARKYFLLAAAQDMTKSQHNLCYLYGGGYGVTKNIDTAISWCEKSANKGFLKSQILLGGIYFTRSDKSADILDGRKWFLKAAAQNDAYSQYMVAQTYYDVPSEFRNFAIALEWANKSAAQNFPDGIKLKSEIEATIAENKANQIAWAANNGKPPAPPPIITNTNGALATVDPMKAIENPIFTGAVAIIIKPLPPRPAFAQVQQNSPSEPIDKKAIAIADFNNVTMPNILAMAPYISKSAAERVAAFPNHQTIYKDCSDAAGTAYQGKEPLANDASYICQSLAIWMNNQDAKTCRFLKWADDKEALAKLNDESVLRTYSASNAKKILLDLEQSAGCKTKDKAYWANRTITLYQNMTKIISSNPETRINISSEALEVIDDDCFSAYLLSDKYSKVSQVARAGCFAIFKYGKGGAYDACTSWLEARRDSESIKETEPLYSELLWLRLSFLELTGKTNCEVKVRELYAQEQATAQQAQAAAQKAYQDAERQKIQKSFDSSVARYLEMRKKTNDLIKERNDYFEDEGYNAEYMCHMNGEIWSAQSIAVLAAREILSLSNTAENRTRVDEETKYMNELRAEEHSSCGVD